MTEEKHTALTGFEIAVLRELVETGGGEQVICFAHLQAVTGLSRANVRTACRGLAAAGLAEVATGFNEDDGLIAGRGYLATSAAISRATGAA